MKLRVVRSGGFAGLARTWEADIPDHEAKRWLPLMENDTGSGTSGAPVNDAFSYSVSLGELTAEVDESAITPAWRELIDAAKNQP